MKTRKQLIDIFVKIALTQNGVKEVGGNNLGPDVVKYQLATWLTPGAWPWCAAFTAWALREFLRSEPDTLLYFKIDAKKIDSWRCRGANTNDWIKWAKSKGWLIIDGKEMAKVGDIVVFDFGHIGIVTEDQLPGKDYAETIEGNTNGKGERDSVSGDGVWKKIRKSNLVKVYLRMP